MMQWQRLSAALLLAVSGTMWSGCGRTEETPVEEDRPLARINDEVLTQADFEFEVQRRQKTGRPIPDAETVLQELVERRVMLQRAQESDIFEDADVQREIENQKLVQWLDRSLQVQRDSVTVTDEEIRAHYEANIEQYTRPAMVRLAILYRRAQPMDAEDTVTQLREELDEARQAFLADPETATQQGRIPGFGRIAAEHSEDTVSRYRGGDLGWLDTSRTDHRWPEEVLSTGMSLEVGDISEVLETDTGLFVIMKTGWRDPVVTPFEEVATMQRRPMIRAKQQAVEAAFMSNLMETARVEIDAEQADRLRIPETETASEPPPLRRATELPLP